MPASKPRRPAPAKAARSRKPAAAKDDSTLHTLARELRSWTDSVLGVASTAAMSFNVAKNLLPTKPAQRGALARAGAFVRDMREAAGLSLKELGKAIDLKDPLLLEAVEGGRAALPFEIILRLASVLARNDPIPFAMRLTRSYSPQLWRALEGLGVARLAQHAGREREFVNIFRSRDAARQLSDEAFARVLAFTDAAFEMALTFAKPPRK